MSSRLDPYREGLQRYCEALLAPYIAALRRVTAPSRSSAKEFNDPIWGTLVFTPFELIFIDSPLLQRLRSIRQLGVVHFVYPSGGHSRFEHSLGVAHQVGEMCRVLSAHVPDTVLDVATQNGLRLAALCHDIGHGVMSHVSENLLNSDVESKKLLLDFLDKAETDSASFSEMAAYYIVESSAFGCLLDEAARINRNHAIPPNTADFVQRAIVGKILSDDAPLLQELINGPFDADKLDYMTRDARMCGVPVITDTARLIRKIRSYPVSAEKLPHHIAAVVNTGKLAHHITGIDASGGRTLDELLLGRTMLQDKLYRHQKVRATEALVGELLTRVLPPGERALAVFKLTDDELLSQPQSDKVSERLRTDLQMRSLPVRAFALAESMPLDSFANDEGQHDGISRFMGELHKADKRIAIRTKIVDELRSAAALCVEIASALEPYESTLEAFVYLDPPASTRSTGGIERAYLIHSDGIQRFRDQAVEVGHWAEAYLLTREIAFVFTPRDIAPATFLAAEKIIRRDYGIRLPESMLRYAKASTIDIGRLRKQLTDAGYYHDAPRDLATPHPRLQKVDVERRFREASEALASLDFVQVDKGRLRAWVRQFEDVEAAIDVATRIRVIGRNDLRIAIAGFLETAQLTNAILVPLGSARDSASVMGYWAADLLGQLDVRVLTLTEALSSPGSAPIVFIDDFVGSGEQGRSIVASWLGDTALSDKLGEKRDAALLPELQERLKSREITFMFTAGVKAGLDVIQKDAVARELVVRPGHVAFDKHSLPSILDTAFYADGVIAENFVSECRRIGERLIGEDSQDPARIESRALGYGNHGLLVAFPYNVPSQCLTCLWKGTRSLDAAGGWAPLLARRKKR